MLIDSRHAAIGAAGYCQRSCGRCNCCSSFQALLQNNSYNTFLQVTP